MFIKNKFNTDYTDNVRTVYHLISDKYGYSARISNIWNYLLISVGLEQFELLDFRLIQNGEFESYLIDEQIKWLNGEDIDFTEIYRAILLVGDFTNSEKILFESSNMEEKLWAIFLAICSPDLDI